MLDPTYNFGTPANIEGSTATNYSGGGHSTGVKFGYYVFLILFLFSFFASIIVIFMLSFTKHELNIPVPLTSGRDIHVILGQFGDTSTGLVLIGTPLMTLAALVGYCHIFNYKPY